MAHAHSNDAALPESAGAKPSASLVATVLTIAVAVVYGRSLDAPFIFDDIGAVSQNPSITSLWPLIGTAQHPGPLNPPRDVPTSARPLTNLTFALNYRIGGLNPIGYHIANTLLHMLNAVLLFVLLRRILRLPYFHGRFESMAGWLSAATALMWSLHPLQTESVIYTTQRNELLFGLFYISTLYCSLRYWQSIPLPNREGQGEGSINSNTTTTTTSSRTRWLALAILSCFAGMASKEVMVSAPLMVLLFDRAFISGSVKDALRNSWPLYAGLASTWLLLLALNIGGPRSASAGFHMGVKPLVWWFTQCQVLFIYLKLVVWPAPLLLNYQVPYLNSFSTAAIYVIPVMILATATLILLWRNHWVAWPLVMIAAILAPTFVVPIPSEVAAERRMYLPLAPLIVLLLIGFYHLVQSLLKRMAAGERKPFDSSAALTSVLLAVPLLALVFSVVSAKRLTDYYDETLMWRQVVDAEPNNYYAHYNLGLLYNYAGREAESFQHLQAAVAANPNNPGARSAFGFALINAGRLPEAVDSLKAALAVEPDHIPAHNNMGIALTAIGDYDGAITHLNHVLKLDPQHAQAHFNLGKALLRAGRSADAFNELNAARSLAPNDADILNTLVNAYQANNQLPQAIQMLEEILRSQPDFSPALNNLGILLYRTGDVRRANDRFRRFQQLNPNDPAAYFNLALVAAGQYDFSQAATLYERAVILRPDSADAHFSFAGALLKSGQPEKSIQHFQHALELNPNMVQVFVGLADALFLSNHREDAIRVANQGIAAANTAGDKQIAGQLEEWLRNH